MCCVRDALPADDAANWPNSFWILDEDVSMFTAYRFRGCLVGRLAAPRHTCDGHGQQADVWFRAIDASPVATDCGSYRSSDWCLVHNKPMAAIIAPSAKTRHTCGG
jgi:hypothetical protein